MSDTGFVLLYRSVMEHHVFRNQAEAMTFAWMVLRATWKPYAMKYKGRSIALQRGQLVMSVRDLADAMDRDKAWIERLFARLKRETMIATSVETGVNVITICNYDKFQPLSENGETVGETANETPARQSRDTERRIEEDKEDTSEPIGSSVSAPRERQPVEDAVADWNEAARRIGWPACQKLSDVRRKHLAARLKDDGIDGWRAALARAASSPFLGGSPPPSWFTFDWLIKAGNYLKLIEGNYDRTHSSGTGNRGNDRQSGWVAAGSRSLRPVG